MERLRTTSSIYFYCRKSKIRKEGLAPIEMGININGQRVFANLPRKYAPDLFEREMKKKQITPLKEYLVAVENSIRHFETICIQKGKKFCTESVKQYIRNGFSVPDENLGYVLDKFYAFVENKNIEGGVKRKYHLILNKFLSISGLSCESGVEEITPFKVREFVDRIKGLYKNSSYAGMLCRFKSFLTFCVENRYLDKNPFAGIRIRKEEVKIDALDEGEVRKLIDRDFSMMPRLEKVRDLFIFSCFTGLAYTDTQRLQPEDILLRDGTYYIEKERAKTGVKYMVVLLPEALDILRKYDWRLPKMTNQRINSYLLEIETLCGLKKHLHFHLARHTAACMFLNKYHFSLEVTAKVLGHVSTKQTAHYAKVFSTTVFESFLGVTG